MWLYVKFLYLIFGFNSNFEVDGYQLKENLFGQAVLQMNAMYIIFPWGDIRVHKMITACAINFYNSVLRLNELITSNLWYIKWRKNNSNLMQEYCFRFIMFYKFSQIRGNDSRQSNQL